MEWAGTGETLRITRGNRLHDTETRKQQFRVRVKPLILRGYTFYRYITTTCRLERVVDCMLSAHTYSLPRRKAEVSTQLPIAALSTCPVDKSNKKQHK